MRTAIGVRIRVVDAEEREMRKIGRRDATSRTLQQLSPHSLAQSSTLYPVSTASDVSSAMFLTWVCLTQLIECVGGGTESFSGFRGGVV